MSDADAKKTTGMMMMIVTTKMWTMIPKKKKRNGDAVAERAAAAEEGVDGRLVSCYRRRPDGNGETEPCCSQTISTTTIERQSRSWAASWQSWG